MAEYQVGQTATNPKTGQKVKWNGSDWVNAGSPSGSIGGPALSKEDKAFLNNLSVKAASMGETRRTYDQARSAVKRLQPGPFRGAFLDVALPTENGGFLDKVGATVVGGPARLLGAISGQEVDDYQKLRGLQSEQVLERQIAQKGPQTESDAARLQLTEISPSKSAAANEKVIDTGVRKTRRAEAQAIFYNKWANKYGHQKPNPEGMTADEVWAQAADHITDKLFPQKGGPTIKVISRRKVK